MVNILISKTRPDTIAHRTYTVTENGRTIFCLLTNYSVKSGKVLGIESKSLDCLTKELTETPYIEVDWD
jgi:hypothetical protein